MRFGGGHQKGSQFERQICRALSLWWTQFADPRDDIFWRSSQSGGRATFRAQKGKRTHGSYGDIAAMDPIGEPLLKVFTIELKCGKSHGDPGDLLDCRADPKCHKWIQTMEQARQAHELAGSKAWMIISHRNFRAITVFFPFHILHDFSLNRLSKPPIFRYRLKFGGHIYDFVGMTFSKFLEGTRSSDFIR